MFQTFDDHTDPASGAQRAAELRNTLAQQGLHGLIIPHDDEYQNEYTPACFERLAWLTGFTGSAGVAVVLNDKAAVFVDGRYTLAVRDQVDLAVFEIVPIMDKSVGTWLKENTTSSAKIGFDPSLHTEASVKKLRSDAQGSDIEFVATERNYIDHIWRDRPAEPMASVVPHPLEFSGKQSELKREEIAQTLKEKGADTVILTNPASIAWLLNVRGGDVAHTPLPLSKAILSKDGQVDWFIDPQKVTDQLPQHLGNRVSLEHPESFASALSALGQEKRTALVDPTSTPYSVISSLEQSGATVVRAEDPCALPKATKNQVEIEGTRKAHIRDGAALTRFLHWLAEEGTSGTVDEVTAVRRLESFRADSGELQDISFETISGAGGNGAIVHYRVTNRTNKKLQPGTLFLVDSGGQYRDGTTDVTRTVAIGEPTQEHRDRFTRVLKGHVGLAAARFPEGTTGAELDVLARIALWKAGLNFDHGTGHGVGSYLGVHEGPQSISRRSFNVALKEGMIISNEPGYYKTDDYGIRIENLVVVTPPTPVDGGERPMLGFETVTLAPIDRSLIDVNMLTDEEITWLNDYHERVRSTLEPLLPNEVAAWLKQAAAPL